MVRWVLVWNAGFYAGGVPGACNRQEGKEMTMRRLRKPVNLALYPELEQVLTASEMARYIGVHRTTLTAAINEGTIAAVQLGRTWLVSKRSAEKLWWKPGTRQKKRPQGSSLLP